MATTGYGSSMYLLNEPRTTTHSYENTVKTPAYENMIYWTPDQGYRYSGNGGVFIHKRSRPRI